MPDKRSKKDLIEYFEEKSQRSAKEGGIYLKSINEILILLNETDDIAEIKAFVRRLHRECLKEIQRTEDVEARIELRKQLGVYDDCLTQIRTIPAQK
jgi:restriction endonuclease S subunit